MKYIISVFILLHCTILTFAQKVDMQDYSIEIMLGGGSFQMNGLKEMNTFIQKSLPYRTQLVADFPSTLFYRAQAIRLDNSFHIGPSFSFFTTGSRLSSADYSGEFKNDLTVNAFVPGIIGSVRINNHKFYKLYFRPTVGTLITKLKVEESLVLFNKTVIDNSQNLTGLNFYFEPAITLQCINIGNIHIGTTVAYGIQALGPGFYDKKFSRKIKNPATGDDFKPNWTGIRLALSILFN